MADEPTTRDAKLIQYLNEAYGKEKQLETALKSHISMTTRDAYKKRLQQHLKETQQQAKGLERRIKQLGGKAEAVDLPGPEALSEAAAKVTAAATKAVAAAKGPVHAVRGTGEAEKLLKNAKTELFNEFEEIANYLAIEELAGAVADRDTAKLAREFRRQEERMASFLQKLIPQLAKQVAREEIPAAERRAAGAGTTRRRTTTARSRTASKAGTSSRSRSSSGGSSTRSGASSRASGTSRSSGGTRASASSRSSRSASSTRSSSGRSGSGASRSRSSRS